MHYKFPRISLLILSCLFTTLHAQILIPINGGPVVNTPSDSRSVNLVDANGDGWDDIFISNGPSGGATCFLYLNNQDGTFTPDSGHVLVTQVDTWDGASFADSDNDGDLDVFVTTWYGNNNQFFGNQGDTAFFSNASFGGNLNTFSETAAWGNAEKDRNLDLFVTNSGGSKENELYQVDNVGWIVPTNTGPIAMDDATSRCVNWVDVDSDGDADLFVANESNEANDLYLNNGDGTFSSAGNLPAGMNGRSSMSSSWGDVDNDGDLDVFIANALYFNEQDNQLFLNDGNGGLTLSTAGDLGGDGGCSYSSSFADYDNDGDLDLFVGNGFCSGTTYNFLYLNDGNGVFNRDNSSAPTLITPCTFGAAWADLDQNGFLDLVIATCKNSSTSPLPNNKLYMNNGGNNNHWIKINLEGTLSNRSAVGARVYVTATINGQSVRQMREVSTQDGYCSQSSFTQHFGLGDATSVDEVEVNWPVGDPLVLTNLPADTVLHLVESMVIGRPDAEVAPRLSVRVITESGHGGSRVLVDNPERVLLEKLEVYDLGGKRWLEMDLGLRNASHVVALPVLPAGMYFVRIGGAGNAVVKFVRP